MDSLKPQTAAVPETRQLTSHQMQCLSFHTPIVNSEGLRIILASITSPRFNLRKAGRIGGRQGAPVVMFH
jgi:hypothetical protein